MAKSYTVTQRIYHYDAFEESDIPAGMSAEAYAEARYCDGYGDLDSHDFMLIVEESGKEDVIIDPVPVVGGVVVTYGESDTGEKIVSDETLNELVNTYYGETLRQYLSLLNLVRCDECGEIVSESSATHNTDNGVDIVACEPCARYVAVEVDGTVVAFTTKVEL